MRILTAGFIALLLVSFLLSCSHESQKKETSTETVVKDVVAGSLMVAAGVPIPVGAPLYRDGSTQIEGKALLSSAGSSFPLLASGVRVVLAKGDEILGRATAESDGSFKFFLRIPEGDYQIRADSSRYMGQSELALKGFKVTDVLLNLSIK
ncbi:hypothetical protein WDW86_15950 [Bdellovibrionota bacterium FG-2]